MNMLDNMERRVLVLMMIELDKKMEVVQEEVVEYLMDKPGTWRTLSMSGKYASIVELVRQRHYRAVRASYALFGLSKILQNKDVFRCIAKDMLQASYAANPAWGEPPDWKLERSCTRAGILLYILMWLFIIFEGIRWMRG